MTQAAGHPQDGQAARATASIPASATGVLTIDLGAIRRNYRKLRGLVAPAECAAVLKADAYGLGAAKVAPMLAAEGCGTFFVATLDEARALADIVPTAAIHVLDGLFPGAAAEFTAIGVRPVLGSMEEIIEWAGHGAATDDPTPAAIHVDTGMNRLGVKPLDYEALSVAGDMLETFPVELVISHLACADTPEHPMNGAQRAAFEGIRAQLPRMRSSLANSAGCFLGPAYGLDLVRPGIALYGGNPFADRPNPVEPVLRLQARIIQMGEAERGESIGYGAARTLARRTRYAVVAAGYADGYVRALGSTDAAGGATGWIGDHALPILGRVSMDLIVFDVTDLPEGIAERGGLVELIGERFTLDDLAARASTIPYEMLTSLGRRYRRVYTGLDDGDGATLLR